MKVLVISPAFPPMLTGEAEHSLLLCEQLADRGFEVYVLTSTNSVKKSGQLTVHPIMRTWTWWDFLRLVRSLRQCQPHAILFIHSGWIFQGHPMVSLLPSIAKLFLPKVSFVTQFEVEKVTGGGSFIERAILRLFEKILGRNTIDSQSGTLVSHSDGIIVLGECHRTNLMEQYSNVAHKIEVIPPPPLLRMCSQGERSDALRRELGIPSDGFVFSYFGYIYKSKGIETLLEAFHKVSSKFDNVWLVMVGGIPESTQSTSYADDLKKLEHELGIGGKMRWTGQYDWDSDEPSVWLNASNACVLPFDFGVKLTNSSFAGAAAHGLPIVTTRGAYLEPQFIHEENVLLCPPMDPDALATVLSTLVENPDLCETLKFGVQVLAKEWFSWSKTIDRTITSFNHASSFSLPSSESIPESKNRLGLALREK